MTSITSKTALTELLLAQHAFVCRASATNYVAVENAMLAYQAEQNATRLDPDSQSKDYEFVHIGAIVRHVEFNGWWKVIGIRTDQTVTVVANDVDAVCDTARPGSSRVVHITDLRPI